MLAGKGYYRPECGIPGVPVKVSVAATPDVPVLQAVLTLSVELVIHETVLHVSKAAKVAVPLMQSVLKVINQ